VNIRPTSTLAYAVKASVLIYKTHKTVLRPVIQEYVEGKWRQQTNKNYSNIKENYPLNAVCNVLGFFTTPSVPELVNIHTTIL
jgi:hypothetical protein